MEARDHNVSTVEECCFKWEIEDKVLYH